MNIKRNVYFSWCCWQDGGIQSQAISFRRSENTFCLFIKIATKEGQAAISFCIMAALIIVSSSVRFFNFVFPIKKSKFGTPDKKGKFS